MNVSISKIKLMEVDFLEKITLILRQIAVDSIIGKDN